MLPAPGFPAEEGHGQTIKRNSKIHFFRTPCRADLVDWVGALFLGHIEIGTSSVFLFLTLTLICSHMTNIWLCLHNMPRLFYYAFVDNLTWGVLCYITCQTFLASCYSPWSWSTLVLHSGQQTDLVSGALLHNLPNFSCLLLCSLVDFPHNCTLRVKQQQQ